jgi:xanthine dehydrogenase molybdenum-binding subunit
MDMLASRLGMDPLEFRLKNANRPGDLTPQGLKITSCGMEECLRRAAEESGWKSKNESKKGTRRGMGIASVMGVCGGARIYPSDGCGSIVKMDDFGKVTLITGSTEIGQGSDIMLAQIVAEEIGVPVEEVQVVNSDTDIKPWDVGSHASRVTLVAGNSARMAAAKVKEKIKALAGEVLGANPDDIEIALGSAFVKPSPDKRMTVAKIVRANHFKKEGGLVIGEHFYDPPNETQDKTHRGNWSSAYGFCSQVAEVEVDEETGKVKILQIASAHDVGRAINPMMIEGQMEGAVSWGIGFALMEELKIEGGKVLNKDFHDYKFPTAKDVPATKTIIVETYDPVGPFGAKGMGDFGLSATAPAIANAIYDATGIRLKELPMTPDKILALLRSRKEAGNG